MMNRDSGSSSMESAYQSSGSGGSTLSKKVRLSSIVLILLVGVAGWTGAMMVYDSGSSDASTAPAAPNSTVVLNGAADYTSVYENASSSVVSIYSNKNGTSSQGSGFVYDREGHIVTNWHVIKNQGTVYIRYSNGEWTTAEIIGSDPYTDLAVLKVKKQPAAVEPLPVSGSVPTIGERVMALGSPDNLRGTVTVGIVSGINRSMTTPQGFVIPDMVQTDAPLNPGNSGGPLVTMDGTVVGVNRARQGENIGFAVSGRIINTVVPSIIEDGKHKHSLVGIRGTPMGPTVANANDIPLRDGILVTEVVKGGPSDGILKGAGGEKVKHNGFKVFKGKDIIIAIDGHEIATNEGLTSYLMRETQPGDTVEFTIIRDGEKKTVNVTLGTRPAYGKSP